MCTAVCYQTRDHYFGRNLDLDRTNQEEVTVTPRNFPVSFRLAGRLERHYAMIGMAWVCGGYPLYYDATNEKGLSIAGLNFPGNACYKPPVEGRENVAPFELIPWLLGQCADLTQARQLLERLNLVDIPFSEQIPLAPLHWMIADKSGCLVLECVRDGLRVYDNPAQVLTNNPPFDVMRFQLNHYMGLSSQTPANRFAAQLELEPYCLGLGALGLPGDLSSVSRLVRAAFTRLNAVSGDSESESVSQMFHILGSVAQQRGCVQVGQDGYEITQYTSCCNTDKGVYYYTTYENSQITGVDLHREDLEGGELICYPLVRGQRIRMQN